MKRLDRHLPGRVGVSFGLHPQVDDRPDPVVERLPPALVGEARDAVGAHNGAESRLPAVLGRMAAEIAHVETVGPAEDALGHGARLLNAPVAEFDAVIVGSGINSLAAGALLAQGGWSVCILERNDWLGGAIKTDELTQDGFLHDVFSAWHPLWVGGAAHAQLGDELGARGLEYLNTEFPTATLFPDGEAAFLLRTADANAAELDGHTAGDGDAWRRMLAEFFPVADLAFGVLGI